MKNRRWLFLMLLPFLALPPAAVMVRHAAAGQSAIVVAEGYSCLGVDKSRRDTEKEARSEARRNAVEQARTFIKSQTSVKDFQVEKDLVEAYSRAEVTVVEELKEGTGWYRDDKAGDCFRYRIKAEVIPDAGFMDKLAKKEELADDPAAPLNVRIWTGRKEYRQGEHIRIFIKGNRPFYARILYRDAGGQTIQLLPNPYRQDNYFQGGVIYELPEGEKDRYRLEIAPPFGDEQLILHASTAPLGDLELAAAGEVYGVKTRGADIGVKSRGVKIVGGRPGSTGTTSASGSSGAEFVERQAVLKTSR
jgi:hypothetical protein